MKTNDEIFARRRARPYRPCQIRRVTKLLILSLGASVTTLAAHAAVHYQVLKAFGGVEEGTIPLASLTQGKDGALYGTTYGGGDGRGTVFKVNQDGTGYSVLHSFSTNAIDSQNPSSPLVEGKDGALYGTTQSGGTYTNGTIFRLNKDGSGYSVLHNFGNGADGEHLLAGLVEGTDGMLYGTTSGGGAYGQVYGGFGTAFRLNKDGSGYSVLHNFGNGADGQGPQAGLVEGTDGALYGTTYFGGTNSTGTVFKMNKDGTAYTMLHSFIAFAADGYSPTAALMQGTDGVLYGTTSGGGTSTNQYGFGTVFRLNRDGTGYRVLYSFDSARGDGAFPQTALIEGGDAALYGTTAYGAVSPGNTSYGPATAFKLNKVGTGYSVLYNFPGDVTYGYPFVSGLILGTNGALYGTSLSGGPEGQNTVFKLNEDGTGYVILHSFGLMPTDLMSPFGGLVEGNDGALYGTAQRFGFGGNEEAALFRLEARSGGYTVLRFWDHQVWDGSAVSGSPLVEGADGFLYGTTPRGGPYTNDYNFGGLGTVFKLKKDGSGYSVLHSFGNVGDGVQPLVGLTQGSDGWLYGTTPEGGAYTNQYGETLGTVFKLNTDGSGYKVLYNFGANASDAAYPSTALLEGSDAALYGTTGAGGTNDSGTVFRLNKDGTGYAVLYNFLTNSVDGESPSALIEGGDGALYGTTAYGGPYTNQYGYGGLGTVFKLNKDGSGYVVLHSFGPTDIGGRSPGKLVEGRDGALYGTAASGGAYTNEVGQELGAVFKLDKDGGGFTVLHSFMGAGSDGQFPAPLLMEGKDGAFYGTTIAGGCGLGTVFRLWPPETPDILDVKAVGSEAQMSFAGVSGYHYQVLRSTDLKNWTSSPTITMPASGVYTNLDGVPTIGQSFYRAAWVP
jgi:uncharacterized repeat protein (TIGR03803 family)